MKRWKWLPIIAGLMVLIPFFAVCFQTNSREAGQQIPLMKSSENQTREMQILKEEDLEEAVAGITASFFHQKKNVEMYKLYAVLIRTNLMFEITHYGKVQKREQMEKGEIKAQDWGDGLLRGVKATEGEVRGVGGNVVELMTHELSASRTRSGEEVFHNSDFSYLQPIDSSIDLRAPDFYTTVDISRETFAEWYQISGKISMEQQVEILEADSAGYVLQIKIGNTVVDGETFRNTWGLASSCFTMMDGKDVVRFFVKGKGHGLGLSWYGAEQMIAQGKTYREILDYYFPATEILYE